MSSSDPVHPGRAATWRATVGWALPQEPLDGTAPGAALARACASLDASSLVAGWVLEQPRAPIAHLHPVATLAAAAVLSRRIALGTAILLPAFRNPVDLANQLLAVDQLCGGRLVAGLGLGGRAEYLDYYGMAAGEHVPRYKAAVETLAQLLAGGTATTPASAPWPLRAARATVPPVRGEGPPLWFGGHARPALARAARMGGGWIGAGANAGGRFLRELAVLRACLDEAGVAREDFVVAKRLYVCVGAPDGDRAARSRRWLRDFYGQSYDPDDFLLAGGVGAIMERVGEWHALGIDHVVLHPLADPGAQLEEFLEGSGLG